MNEIEATLKKIVDLSNLVYSKEAYWEVKEMALLPPASEKQISKLSKNCPHPLPQSYQEFLKQHNGCLNFWAKFTLLGSEEKPYEFIQEEIEDARAFQKEYAADGRGELTSASIAKFETVSESQKFFLPNHVIFGANGGGEFFMFNENLRTADGEYEVIHYTYDGGAYYRYPDFASFLTATQNQLEKRIKAKGYARAKR